MNKTPKADYWKSQAKKYCNFCKCWIADNKPSVEFHEKGRKHLNNVQKQLKFIGRQSRRDQKESERAEHYLKKMESAAMEAYRKDIEANASADLSSQSITEQLEKNNLAISSKKCWYESKKDGKTFYWNKETNEKMSTPPSCGFLTLAEQQQEAFLVGKQQLQAASSYRSPTDLLRIQEEKQKLEEERAAAAREKMKERRVVEEPPEPVSYGPIIEEQKGPYGNWKVVETTKPKEIDLGLPPQEEYVPVVIPAPEPPPREFKEKTVDSLGDENEGACVGFKKRKFGGNQKRNVRQRFDND